MGLREVIVETTDDIVMFRIPLLISREIKKSLIDLKPSGME